MRSIRTTYIFTIIFGLYLANVSNGQRYDKSYYLIDSVDYVFAQPSDLLLMDSVLEKYHDTKDDTSKLVFLNEIINNCYNDRIWPAYNEILYSRSQNLFSDTRMTNSNWSFKVLSMHALSLNNKGYLEYYRGNISAALTYYQESLNINEHIEDSSGIAQCLNNIGGVFYMTEDYEKSIDYFKRSLLIKKEYSTPLEIATSLNNIGSIYNLTGNLDSAKHYYEKSLNIYEVENDKEGLALSYHNLGSINSKQGNSELAHLFFLKSIRISEELNDLAMVANSYLLLAKLYISDDLTKAEMYGVRSLENAEDLGYPAEIKDAAEILIQVYRKKGHYEKALNMYDRFVEMKDSVMTAQIRNDLENQQITYEYEKKALSDSLSHQEENRINKALIAKQHAKIQADKILKISLIAGVLLLVFIAIVIWISLRNSKRAKIEIAKKNEMLEEQFRITDLQKEKLAEKNREIVDSINYARRLQEGFLPSLESIVTNLPQSFVLYLPKDIVAGDFYWTECVNDTVYFAVADCTGHGVPGAFVSLVCSNALNTTILEKGNIAPNEVLEHVTDHVVDAFNKSEHQIKDGMDIALCAINTKTLQLQYSGAYNPLWVVSKRKELGVETKLFENGKDLFLHEIKATKQPIGKYTFKKPFEVHHIQLNNGDQIYLTSDGFPDQFGGDKGKKLKYRNMKSMILAYSDLSMPKQQESLLEAFTKWKSDFEQVDDVCVIGVRV